MAPQDRTAEQVIGALATGAKGVVTHEELELAGVTRAEIRWRLQAGLLIPEHRGVYRVGHRAANFEATYLAAVKACGPRALLFGPAASYLFGVLKGTPPRPEVVAPTERRVKGLITHRSRGLSKRDGTTYRGIPVTTLPRTIVDMAGRLDSEALALLCHEAAVQHHLRAPAVQAVLSRCPNAKGAANLRRVLEGDVPVLLSELEKRFLELLTEDGLPLPLTNRPAGGRRVDCRWPDYRLTVELDSYTYHHTRHAWERDSRGWREARERGEEFRRFTRDDVFEGPQLVLAELRPLLRAIRSGPRP